MAKIQYFVEVAPADQIIWWLIIALVCLWIIVWAKA